MNNSNNANPGIGMGGALLIVFLVLKLCEVIDWSWWWVLAPMWVPVAVLLIILVVVLIVR